MVSPLAKTVFATNVDDSLGAVDVYTQTSAKDPIDDVSGSSSGGGSLDLASFMGVESAATTADQLTSIAASDKKFLTPANIEASVISPNSDLQGFYRQVDDNLQATLIAPNDALNNIQLTDLQTPLDLPSVSSATSAKNYTAISGMLNVIGGTAGGNVGLTVKDTGAQGAFLSNLVSVSARLGIPNAYARIDSGGYGSRVMGQVTTAALHACVSTSNVNLLMNLSRGSMAGSINAMFPEFGSRFAANFRLPTGTSPGQHGQIGMNIRTAFGTISPNWNSRTGPSLRTVLNGNIFYGASDDFRSVMRASATLSRGPFGTNVSGTVNVAASSLPNPGTMPPNVLTQVIPIAGGRTRHLYQWPSGYSEQYDSVSDGTYDRTHTDPVDFPTDSSLYSTFNNSTISDPLAQGHAFSECLRQGANDPLSAVSPTLPASDSLKLNFPYTNFGPLSDLSL